MTRPHEPGVTRARNRSTVSAASAAEIQLARILLTCVFVVYSAITSVALISAFDKPRAIRRAHLGLARVSTARAHGNSRRAARPRTRRSGAG